MKFTQDEFSEKLKEKLTDNGKKTLNQSERTFKKLVEKNYKRIEKYDEEIELDDAVADYIDDFQEIEGNYNKDRADFAKKFEANWKKKHPQKKKDDDDDDDDNDDDDDDDDKDVDSPLLKKLLKKLEKMEQKESEREAKEKASEKAKILRAKLKNAGVDKEEWLEGYISKLNINEETDIEREIEDALKLFNLTKASDNNMTPPGSAGGGNKEFNLDYLKKKKN